jgi:hypothetical protein
MNRVENVAVGPSTAGRGGVGSAAVAQLPSLSLLELPSQALASRVDRQVFSRKLIAILGRNRAARVLRLLDQVLEWSMPLADAIVQVRQRRSGALFCASFGSSLR